MGVKYITNEDQLTGEAVKMGSRIEKWKKKIKKDKMKYNHSNFNLICVHLHNFVELEFWLRLGPSCVPQR
jgi:hypothetical protein